MIRIGTIVRLKLGCSYTRGPRKFAKVIAKYSDIKGGVILDREFAGFRSWNLENLERVSAGQPAKA